MQILIIGGSGTISAAVAKRALEQGHSVTLLKRTAHGAPEGAQVLCGDVRDEAGTAALLQGRRFDAVAQFVAYTPDDVRRDIRLFSPLTRQYLFISSASAYQKPVGALPITESTPLANPYWQYSRDKAACEDVLMDAWRKDGFPVTIVRPSHTYNEKKVPLPLRGDGGSWQTLARMRAGKAVIIPGDGCALWTMTHADDFAAGFAGLFGNPRALGQAVHITSDEAMTWTQIYAVIAEALGCELRPAYISSHFLAACGGAYDLRGQLLGDKTANVCFDNTKIKRLVPGFACRISMAQGLRAAVEYALAHPECQQPDPAFDAWCERVLAARDAALAHFQNSAR